MILGSLFLYSWILNGTLPAQRAHHLSSLSLLYRRLSVLYKTSLEYQNQSLNLLSYIVFAMPTLYSLYCIACISLPVLHCLHCIAYTALPALHCLHGIAYIALPALYCLHCIACTALPTLHCLYCIACIALPTVHCLHCIVYTALPTLHCLHSIAYITLPALPLPVLLLSPPSPHCVTSVPHSSLKNVHR